MAEIEPIRIWRRYTGEIQEELLGSSPTPYETKPKWPPTQWIKSQPLYDKRPRSSAFGSTLKGFLVQIPASPVLASRTRLA